MNANIEVAPSAAAKGVSGFSSRPAAWALCLTLLLGVGILRIVSTYYVFNHTIDEPSHLACGMEWWEKGVYRIETKHPPLARISVALLPYLSGLRSPAEFNNWMETYPILSADGHYWRNLTLARIGALPYFIIATLVVFFWAKRLFGPPAGLLAAAIFTMVPPILAHSAVAATDIPLAAMFAGRSIPLLCGCGAPTGGPPRCSVWLPAWRWPPSFRRYYFCQHVVERSWCCISQQGSVIGEHCCERSPSLSCVRFWPPGRCIASRMHRWARRQNFPIGLQPRSSALRRA